MMNLKGTRIFSVKEIKSMIENDALDGYEKCLKKMPASVNDILKSWGFVEKEKQDDLVNFEACTDWEKTDV